MPNLPITQLPSASALQPTNVFPVVQSGITKQSTFSQIIYSQGNSYGLFAQTANSTIVTGTTTESTLINGGVGTLIVPANGFQIGDSFRADFGGLLSSKNNDTIRIRVKAGSVILADSGPQTMSTAVDDVWQLSINFTVRTLGGTGVASIVSLGVFHSTKQSNGAQTGFAFNTVNNTTFNTTISNTLNVTVQFSSNSTDNSIYSDIFVLNKIY
jgi:hypothetical protein